MSPRQVEPLPSEIQAELAAERDYPRQPAEFRVRALARARAAQTAAALGSGRARFLLPSFALPVLALTALASAAAYGWKISRAGESPTSMQRPPPTQLVEPATSSVASAAEPDSKQSSATLALANEAKPSGAMRIDPKPRASASTPDKLAALELRLLQRARASIAERNFTSALGVLDEYQRRFPAGRLREEFEALRVKALSGLGKEAQAKQAAEAFRSRFPRSVLLSPVEGAVGGPH